MASEDEKQIGGKGFTVQDRRRFSPETGDAQIDMSVDYNSESIDVGFNPQYLIDVLRVIKADSFELHLGQSDRPGLIKSGNNFLYIVMPVNL